MTWKKLVITLMCQPAKAKHISKLSKFYYQLSSFITTLWVGVNYKVILLVDLKISCGCIPEAIKQEKVYTQGQLKLTHITFLILGKNRGVTFFRGVCNCHIKNKLKSEIFNDKKSFISKNIFLCHN